MAAYCPVRTLTPEIRAYIAGLIDGEGTVTLTRLHRNENRRLVVSIANNDLGLLRYVRDCLGAGKITSKRAYNARHAASYCFQVSSRQALGLLRQTLPYLRTYKKERATLAIQKYLRVTPRNGKYSAKLVEARDIFVKTFLSIRWRKL